MKFYLAREGVAFGPFTELQLRESVRIGIFESADLALPEDGTEWRPLGELFPVQAPAPAEPLAVEKAVVAVAPVPVVSPVLEKALDAPVPIPILPANPNDPASVPQVTPGRGRTRRQLAFAAIPLTALCCVAAIWIGWRQRPDRPLRRVTPLAEVEFRTTDVPPSVPAQASPAEVQPMDLTVSEAADPALVETAPVPNQQDSSSIPAEPPETAATAAPEQKPASSETRRQIEGQIFISARNGINYEPPAVEVRLYPLNLLKPYLEKRSSEASARFEQLKTQINEAEAEKELLRKAADAAFDAYVQANASNRRALEQANADAKKAREKATNVYYELLQSRQDLLSGAFYLEDLPKAIDVTRTDSQGRFSFDLPVDGEFAVVAGAQRSTDDEVERYYWFVPVSIDGEPRKTVLLSNNNISSHGSADSLLQTAD